MGNDAQSSGEVNPLGWLADLCSRFKAFSLSIISYNRRRIAVTGEFLILAGLIFVVTDAIAEILARQNFDIHLVRRIDALRDDLLLVRAPNANETTVSTKEELILLSCLRQLRHDNDALMLIGANSSEHILFSMRSRSSSVECQGEVKIPKSNDAGWSFLRVEYLNSERLLAIVVIFCGAIGSITVGLTSHLQSSNEKSEIARIGIDFRRVSIGVAAGFVCFLAIKGGKGLFLLQSGEAVVRFNPYSSAFVGFIVGFFTDRAHRLLIHFADAFVSRLQSAFLAPHHVSTEESVTLQTGGKTSPRAKRQKD